MRRTTSLHGGWPVVFGLVVSLLAVSPAAAQSEATRTTVVVQPGQTLWSLARQYGVSVEAIVQANDLDSPSRIAAGQKLVIPSSRSTSSAAPVSSRTSSGTRAPLVVTVRAGQTLWSIARAHGISVDAILRANGLSSSRIRAGQRLVIPVGATTGPRTVSAASPKPVAARPSTASTAPARIPLVVVVRRGETLSSLSRAFDVSVGAIVKANNLKDPNRLSVGQRVRIPGRFTTPRPTPAPVPIPEVVRLGPKFAWPVSGDITSRFGPRGRRHHDGIDIAAARGTGIVAARDGEVVFAGWYYGYGRTVVLDHGDGVTTLYGHASSLLVKRGERVRQGQVVGAVGCTGRCTGSHVHFEIRINGRAVNPIAVFDVQKVAGTAAASPVGSPAPAAEADSAGQPGAGQEAAAETEVIVRQFVVADGATVTTVKEHLRGDVVVRREEDTVTSVGCGTTSVKRIFERTNGQLAKVSERRSAQRCANPRGQD